MPADEFFWSDGPGLVAGAVQGIEVAVRSDDEIRIRGDGAIREGIIVRITDDGVEAVIRSDLANTSIQQIDQC